MRPRRPSPKSREGEKYDAPVQPWHKGPIVTAQKVEGRQGEHGRADSTPRSRTMSRRIWPPDLLHVEQAKAHSGKGQRGAAGMRSSEARKGRLGQSFEHNSLSRSHWVRV